MACSCGRLKQCPLWTPSKKPSLSSVDSTLKYAGNAEPETLQQQINAENAAARTFDGKRGK
jgi:hypothetical protein